MQRDSIPEGAALQRMEMQLPESFFRSHSDTVLENNGSLQELYDSAQELVTKMICYYESQYGALLC